jgi:predicted GIY-YIG superfamily endonuclease
MFYLYVVALDEAVWTDNRFRWQNLQRNPRRPCVYVGQTARRPEERLAQHKSGVKANPYVRRFGGELLEDLTGPVEARTRREAEAAERALADRLRRQGYGVWSR